MMKISFTRRRADFTLRKQYFTARQRNFTLRQQDFTADVSPHYPCRPLAWRSISSTTMSYISPKEAQYSSTFHGSLVW